MNAMTTGLCFAAAVGLAATLGAQSPTSTTTSRPMTGDKDHEVTITGCLSKASGGFMLTNARMDTDKSSSTTTAPGSTTTASGSSTTSATGTSGSTREGAASMSASTWMLSGDKDLEKHVGHKITVTGKTTSEGAMEHGRTAATTTSGSGTTAAPPSATTASEPHLDVKSIKMVSSSCS